MKDLKALLELGKQLKDLAAKHPELGSEAELKEFIQVVKELLFDKDREEPFGD